MGLDTVELVLAVEQVFSISISDETAGKITTVGALHEYVVAELDRLGRPNVNRDVTYDLLRNVICFQLGVEPEKVVPSARFVQDLGAA
jgi:acyl carrier protein